MNPFGGSPYGSSGYGSGGYGSGGYGSGSPYGQPQQSAPWEQQQGMGYSPYGMPPAGPSGATAITAGVLAVLGGVAALVAIFGAGVGMVSVSILFNSAHVYGGLPGWYVATTVIGLICNVAVAALLITGGIMMFLRKRLSPMLVTIGCGVSIAGSIIGVIAAYAYYSEIVDSYGYYYGYHTPTYAFSLVGLIFPIATIVLAQLRSTKLYCTR